LSSTCPSRNLIAIANATSGCPMRRRHLSGYYWAWKPREIARKVALSPGSVEDPRPAWRQFRRNPDKHRGGNGGTRRGVLLAGGYISRQPSRRPVPVSTMILT